MNKLKLTFFLITVLFCRSVWADCYGVITLPLSMRGVQNQLMWSGSIGGSGSGSTTSNCPSAGGYQYDYRYNIVSTEATCRNYATNVQYKAPVETSGATIETGPMTKLGQNQSNGVKYDIWGALFNSPAIQLPVTGSAGGSYSTNAKINISDLPAGKYSCSVLNAHGAFGTNSANALASGVNSVWYLTHTNNLWATGFVDVEIFSSCSVPDVVNISHGSVAAGSSNVQQKSFQITCNKDNVVSIVLKGNEDAGNGVWVDVGNSGSKSLLSVSGGTGKQTSLSVKSNIPQTVTLKSELSAKGYGSQSGNALAVVSYN
ncbi:hypothetical protein [Escherichia coli]|uniref:hypothetical protein n=1 Tax=Escherichia coli TaxID=562 RepID=UPI001C408930|nr:hypothetical protein [Escherichia coli]